jgi:ribosomal-protein-alanine N-acetyltransferase
MKYDSERVNSEDEAREFIDRMRRETTERKRIMWGVASQEDNCLLGMCGLANWSAVHQRAELGFDLRRDRWGKSLAYEATMAVVRFGFEQLKLHRIEAFTVADNTRSVRLLERLGFKREGLQRDASMEADGAFHDCAQYGLLRTDLPD